MTFIALFMAAVLTAVTAGPKQKDYAKLYESLGLLDVAVLEPSIKVELRYATTNNFLGRNVYGGLVRAYLEPGTARMLVTAQSRLKALAPQLTPLVYDAARPQDVQRAMWDIVKGTKNEEFVANPQRGSDHCYGCAVDLTLAGTNGGALDMGTEFDSFSDLAKPSMEGSFLKMNVLKPDQLSNRLLLRLVMTNAGFQFIPNEWWHFKSLSRDEMKKRLKLID